MYLKTKISLIIFLLAFLAQKNYSKEDVKETGEWNFEYSGFVILNTISFPAGGKIIHITNKFTWKDSFGNYGKGKCYGTVESYIKTGDTLKYYCEMNDQDDEKFFTKGGRESENVDAGVGTQDIIDGTGKWKTFIGSTCTYGIKYKDDVVFASQKCKLPKS